MPKPTNELTAQPQPSLRAVPMTVFPTLGTLNEVVELGESKLPISDKNELFSLLMTYHNTLLKVST
jgi:hypothetical protein